VFRAMLASGMKESQKNCIELNSADPRVVKLFIQLLYEGKADLPTVGKLVIPLIQLAHQYQVDPIVSFCENFLIRNFCAYHAFKLYGVAKLLNLSDLFYMAVKYINR